MEGGEGERCLVGTFMPCHAGAFFLVAALPSPLLGTRRAREDRHTEREACSSELSSELEAGLFCAWCGHRAVSGDVGIWTYRHAYRSFCVRRGFPRVAVLSTRVSHWRARRAGRFGKKRSTKQTKQRKAHANAGPGEDLAERRGCVLEQQFSQEARTRLKGPRGEWEFGLVRST